MYIAACDRASKVEDMGERCPHSINRESNILQSHRRLFEVSMLAERPWLLPTMIDDCPNPQCSTWKRLPDASFDTFISARLVVVALSRFSFVGQWDCAKRPKQDQTNNYLVWTVFLSKSCCRADAATGTAHDMLPNLVFFVAMYRLFCLRIDAA